MPVCQNRYPEADFQYDLSADGGETAGTGKHGKGGMLLMLPDYFHFLLTGNKMSEYTNATSTQLVSPETRQWDCELIERLGYKLDIPSASYARNGSGAFFPKKWRKKWAFPARW